MLLCCSHAFATIRADNIAIVVNEADPTSLEIGRYYAQKRGISPLNIARIRLPHQRAVLSSGDFKTLFKKVLSQVSPDVEAFVLTWLAPYRVDCMSITSAFTFGFARRYCATGCKPTAPNPFFDSGSSSAFKDFGMRPTMTIAAETLADAKALIDRGVAADATHPKGKAYLVITKDTARNTRAPQFQKVQETLGYRIPSLILRQDGLKDARDVMFYFTGSKSVPYLNTLSFLPGAVADHLTSHGGKLTGSSQMNALEWLKAGATGSYGTVVEPCNFPQKFPQPEVMMHHYLAGNTLIEAYWKSVVWPGQGIFIGEPLSAPYQARPEDS